MATRVMPPAGSASLHWQEPRHGQPSVIADVAKNMAKKLLIILIAAFSLFVAFISGLFFGLLHDSEDQSHRHLHSAQLSLQIANLLREGMDETAFAILEGDAFLALTHTHYLANSASSPEYLRRRAIFLEESLLNYFSTNPPPMKHLPNDFFDTIDGMTQENRLEMRNWLEEAEANQAEALKILNDFKSQK